MFSSGLSQNSCPTLGPSVNIDSEQFLELKKGYLLGEFRNYRLKRKLGEGGMGQTWLADELSGGEASQEVVCKILSRELRGNLNAMKDIQRVFELTRQLNHTNICPLLGKFKDPVFGSFLVMKYADGGTLADWFAAQPEREKGLSAEKVLPILRPIASALDYLHQLGVLHRDVKPQNIMFMKVGKKFVPVLIDFGISARIRQEHCITQNSQSVDDAKASSSSGTPRYMAPEQQFGKKQGRSTDQYSLALVAYELLNGTLPFSGNRDEIAVMKSKFTPGNSRFTERMKNAFRRGLAFEASARFGSCTEFLDALASDAEKNGVRQAKTAGWLASLALAGGISWIAVSGMAKTDLESAEAELATVKADWESANERAETAEAELATVKADLATANGRAESAEAGLKTANERAESAEAELVTVKADWESANKRAESAEAELATANERAESAEAGLTTVKADLATARQRENAAVLAKEKAEEEAGNEQKRLLEENKKLQELIDTSETGELAKQITELQKKVKENEEKAINAEVEKKVAEQSKDQAVASAREEERKAAAEAQAQAVASAREEERKTAAAEAQKKLESALKNAKKNALSELEANLKRTRELLEQRHFTFSSFFTSFRVTGYTGKNSRVVIPPGVSSIGPRAFYGSSIDGISFPENVTIICEEAFGGCDSLVAVRLPEGLKTIESSAFWECSYLESVEFPSTLERIGDYAFKECTKLEKVTLQDGVARIGAEAFRGCSRLKYVVIPASVTSIGTDAFRGCGKVRIWCVKGSFAEKYAKQNEIPFGTFGG
ncbi:MAG: leucine-rich repeat protein [Thermoguttaceae bacterium]|nr:leucine-rich repeat protein [Thermoguttaceae bacterium]